MFKKLGKKVLVCIKTDVLREAKRNPRELVIVLLYRFFYRRSTSNLLVFFSPLDDFRWCNMGTTKIQGSFIIQKQTIDGAKNLDTKKKNVGIRV